MNIHRYVHFSNLRHFYFYLNANIRKYAIVIIFLHLVNMFVAKCCIFYHNKKLSVTSCFIVYLLIAICKSKQWKKRLWIRLSKKYNLFAKNITNYQTSQTSGSDPVTRVSLSGFLSIPAPPHLLITVTYLVAVGCTVAAVAVVVLDKENLSP